MLCASTWDNSQNAVNQSPGLLCRLVITNIINGRQNCFTVPDKLTTCSTDRLPTFANKTPHPNGNTSSYGKMLLNRNIIIVIGSSSSNSSLNLSWKRQLYLFPLPYPFSIPFKMGNFQSLFISISCYKTFPLYFYQCELWCSSVIYLRVYLWPEFDTKSGTNIDTIVWRCHDTR